MKINQMKTEAIRETMKKLESTKEKVGGKLEKGRETESKYYQHLKTELQARASEGAV